MASRLCLSFLPRRRLFCKQTTLPPLATFNFASFPAAAAAAATAPTSTSSSTTTTTTTTTKTTISSRLSSTPTPPPSSSSSLRYFSTSSTSSPPLLQRLFSEKHEWVRIVDGVGTVGVSNYAQEALGDIVYAQLPEVDAELEADEECGALESVKAASEIYTPVGGVVVAINENLADNPGVINASPYEDGWLFKIKVEGEAEGLMDDEAYVAFLESQDH